MKSGYLSEIFISFQGEGAHVGRRHLFVRLAGCNMRCRYCDTPDSLERSAGYTIYGPGERVAYQENPVSAVDLAHVITSTLESEPAVDAIALTGGEPLVQSEFLVALLEAGRFRLPVLLETNGVLPQRLRDVLPFVHIISMDIKLPSNTSEPAFWEEHAAFLVLARGKDLYVKILVDQSTTDAEVERAACLLAPLRPPVPAFLQPIVAPDARPLIAAGRLTDLYVLARQHLDSIRVLPQTHKLLGIR